MRRDRHRLRLDPKWIALVALLATPAEAQVVVPDAPVQGIPLDRPAERERELPEIERPRVPVLPPAPPPRPERRDELASGLRVRVREFRFEGNTVFDDQELAQVAAPYLGRELGAEDLRALRDALTLHYARSGYVNSGAILPDQEVGAGVVVYRIVEGRLAAVEIEGNRHFRPGYLRSRLDPGRDEPLRIQALEERLQVLLQDDRIRRLDAQLGPGDRLGEAVLDVQVEETSPWRAWLEASNHQSPSIGAERGRVHFAHRNLTGNGDVLGGFYGLTEGLDDVELAYELPITARDTRLRLRFRHSDSDVVEEPFDDIDIESTSVTYGITLSHPLWRDVNSELEIGLSGEWRESRTYLLDRRFSFSPGAENGKTRVSVLRFFQQWIHRDEAQVLAARSSVNLGIDAFGATTHGGSSTEDGQFLSWLGQFQWVRRFERLWGIETVLRTDVQLTSSPLLPLEQFSVGGASSVRGYRENQLVRDMGIVGSLETRIPVWSTADRRFNVQLAPFFDVGRAWNTKRPTPSPKTISSAGVGLRFAFARRLQGEIYWAEEIRDVEEPDDRDLQDTGVHFRVYLGIF